MMKWLVVLLLGTTLASATQYSLVEQLKPTLDRLQKLPTQLQRSRSAVRLHTAIGAPADVRLDFIEAKILEELGKHIREHYEKVLKRLEVLGKEARETKESLRKALFHQIPTAQSAKEFITQLSAFDKEREILENQLNIALTADINSLVETFGIADWWEKVKEWLKGLGAAIPDKLNVFKDWVKGIFEKAIDGSKPLIDQIKALAKEFLKNNGDNLTKELVKQALQFFTPFKGQLGDEIADKLVELAKKFNLLPWTKQ